MLPDLWRMADRRVRATRRTPPITPASPELEAVLSGIDHHLDIDRWFQRAVDAGCEVTTPLQVMFWGDRWGAVRDPFGVHWAMNAPVKKA